MGDAGSPHALFRRALATGNLTIATSAAHEVARLSLEDALALTLLYRDQDPSRYERAALRWHARFCAEVRGLSTDDAQLALSALASLGGSRPESGARSLLALLDGLTMSAAADALEAWLQRRGEH